MIHYSDFETYSDCETGKAIVCLCAGKPLEERWYPIPTLEPKAILVKTMMSTVCGSDMHTWRGKRSFPTPSIFGHEILGKIVKLGENIERDSAGNRLAEGDRVTWTIMSNCGTCYFCRNKGLPMNKDKLNLSIHLYDYFGRTIF